MSYTLIKCSYPEWKKNKEFKTKDELIYELRKCICNSCLQGSSDYIDNNGNSIKIEDYYLVDVEYNGQWFYCRDIGTLLGTACGLEYTVEIDGKPYYED